MGVKYTFTCARILVALGMRYFLAVLYLQYIEMPDSLQEIMNAKTIFSITMLSLFAVIFVGQMFFHMFNGISPLQYTVTSSTGRSR